MPTMIPVSRLMRHCNPFNESPWDMPVSREDVARALSERRLVATPGTDDHAGRIAYFVENEPDDPIEIDVGVPVLRHYAGWLIIDGNHRFAAAIYANRQMIHASVGGQLDYAKALFGVDCDEPLIAQSLRP